MKRRTIERLTHMIKAILFDMDGTLLRCDTYAMINAYLQALSIFAAERTNIDPRLIAKAVMLGAEAMVQNGGRGYNIDRFMDAFCRKTGLPAEVSEFFSQYYIERYDDLACFANQDARTHGVIAAAKARGFALVLATSPLLPELAARKRMRWIGLDEEDFSLITHCDNMHYCKPDPGYFLEIGEMLGLAPNEMAVVGNDGKDDAGAVVAGMPLFLLKGYDIALDEAPAEAVRGGFDELIAWINAL